MQNVLSFTAERERLAYQRGQASFDLLATMGRGPEVAELILRHKGVVLDSVLEDDLLTRSLERSELKDTSTTLQATRRQLALLQGDQPKGLSEANVKGRELAKAGLEQKLDELQQAAARHVSGFGRTRRALGVTAGELQTALPAASVMVELVRYNHYLGNGKFESRYGAALIGGSTVCFKGGQLGQPVWVALGSTASIGQSMAAYRTAMRAGRKGDEAILRELYLQLVDPIQPKLPDGTRSLIIVPDAELNFLNFGTLLGGDGRFLAEEYSIKYLTSGRDLLSREEAGTTARTLVAFANPNYLMKSAGSVSIPTRRAGTTVPGPSRDEVKHLDFQPLPGTDLEARNLDSRAPTWRFLARTFSGSTATEQEIRQLQSPGVLHLATHGFVLPDTGGKTTNQYRTLLEPPGASTVNNPMLRSGLALAGAQTTLEAWKRGEVPPTDNDGILTAQEVGALNLRNTWLVVLSACDTGLGEARNGEGVLGLRRGFVQAGAQNLLLTLWPISDKWSVEIMQAFYEQAMVTGDAPQAMADVQAEWLARLRKEKGALLAARIAGPFVLTSRGKPLTK